jgi:hypothetical protein
VTVVVTAPPLAVAALPLLVAAAEIILPNATTAMNGITIVRTVITTAVTVIATMIVGIAMIAGIVIVIVLVAPRTGSAMSRMIARDARMIARDARMIGSAAKRSVRSSRTVKIGKVRGKPPSVLINYRSAHKIDQYPWTPFLLLMMSLILLSRSTQCDHLSEPCLRVANYRRSTGHLLTTDTLRKRAPSLKL